MRIEIEDFKTGWCGLTIAIKKEEIDELIDALKTLKQKDDHFHMRSDYAGTGGVGDVEFYIQNENERNNMKLDISPPLYPK